MDGFTKTAKMQCFKEGGSVQREVHNFTKRDRKSVEMADTKEDKKIVKKAFGMHDAQKHDGEKTDLSKLKKGGRAKKAAGTVKKFCGGGNAYKEGGSVTNVYEAKKSSGDLDNIEKVKGIKPGKAAAPSKAAVKSKSTLSSAKDAGDVSPLIKSKASGKAAVAPSGAKGGPNKYKCGGKVKKYEGGGSVLSDIGTGISNAILGTPAQNKQALANEAKYLAAKRAQRAAGTAMSPNEMMAMKLAQAGQGAGLGQAAPAAPGPAMPNVDQMGSPTGIPAQKKGGKVKKMNTGGTAS